MTWECGINLVVRFEAIINDVTHDLKDVKNKRFLVEIMTATST